MFTCPKCKTTWSSGSFICTCGERVLYIPDELKEKVYLIYGVSGYDEVVNYIKNYNENVRIDSIKKIEIKQRQAEIDSFNAQKEAEQNSLDERRKKKNEKLFLIFSLSSVAIFLLYLVTPLATRLVSAFISCEVKPVNWKLLDYLFFWTKTAGFILLICGLLLYFFYVFRSAITGGIRLDVEKGERSNWMVNSAILFSAKRGSGLTDAARGAVVGAVAHHTYYSILDSLKIFFILGVPILIFLSFSNKIYCKSPNLNSAVVQSIEKAPVDSTAQSSVSNKSSASISNNSSFSRYLKNQGFNEPKNIRVAISEDFSGDGLPDYVFYNEEPGYCGTAGCVAQVIVSNGNGFNKIYEGFAHEIVPVGQGGGKRNLQLSLHGSACNRAGAEGCYKQLVWIGSKLIVN